MRSVPWIALFSCVAVSLPAHAAPEGDPARALSVGLVRMAKLRAEGWALVEERLGSNGACDAIVGGIVESLRARKAEAVELAEAVKAQRAKAGADVVKQAQALAKEDVDRSGAAEKKSRQAAVMRLRALAARCPAQAKELKTRANGYAAILSP